MDSAKGVLRELLEAENVVTLPVVKKEKVKFFLTQQMNLTLTHLNKKEKL